MKIRIETREENRFENLQAKYGPVLSGFGLSEDNGYAVIAINSLDELFVLDRDIRKYIDKSKSCNPYFGLAIRTDDDGVQYLEIQDNY